MDITLVALIVLAVLGTGLLWLSSKEGGFAWRWKNRLFGEISAEAKGKTSPDIVQTQQRSAGSEQTASKDAKSRQEQVDSPDSVQRIE